MAFFFYSKKRTFSVPGPTFLIRLVKKGVAVPPPPPLPSLSLSDSLSLISFFSLQRIPLSKNNSTTKKTYMNSEIEHRMEEDM